MTQILAKMVKPSLAAAAGLVLMAGTALADPVLGTWKTQPDDNGNYGLVTLSMCGAEICGVIGKGFDSSGKELSSPNIGRKVVWAMKPQGGGQYKGGKIWSPDRDKTYNSKMSLAGSTLKVEGCVLGICRGQTWSRAN